MEQIQTNPGHWSSGGLSARVELGRKRVYLCFLESYKELICDRAFFMWKTSEKDHKSLFAPIPLLQTSKISLYMRLRSPSPLSSLMAKPKLLTPTDSLCD